MYSTQLPAKSKLRKKSTLDCGEGTLSQELIQQANINHIVNRHLRTGTPFPTGSSQFLDTTQLPDFQTRLDLINQGNHAFQKLPAKVKQFYKTPEAFLNALEDPHATDDLIHLGILKKTTPETTVSKSEAKPNSGAPATAGGTSVPSGTSNT